jgi:hypothetical protein
MLARKSRAGRIVGVTHDLVPLFFFLTLSLFLFFLFLLTDSVFHGPFFSFVSREKKRRSGQEHREGSRSRVQLPTAREGKACEGICAARVEKEQRTTVTKVRVRRKTITKRKTTSNQQQLNEQAHKLNNANYSKKVQS